MSNGILPTATFPMRIVKSVWDITLKFPLLEYVLFYILLENKSGFICLNNLISQLEVS